MRLPRLRLGGLQRRLQPSEHGMRARAGIPRAAPIAAP